MSLDKYTDEDLLLELERRNIKVSIKITGVDVICRIADKEFEVRAL